LKTAHKQFWMKCYRFKLAQFIQLHDKVKRYIFCCHIFSKISVNKTFLGNLLLSSEEATLHVSETVLKTNTFCGCGTTMVYRHFLTGEQTVAGDT
jgi:hypothetical protein